MFAASPSAACIEGKKRISLCCGTDIALILIALKGKVPRRHVPAYRHYLVIGKLQSETKKHYDRLLAMPYGENGSSQLRSLHKAPTVPARSYDTWSSYGIYCFYIHRATAKLLSRCLPATCPQHRLRDCHCLAQLQCHVAHVERMFKQPSVAAEMSLHGRRSIKEARLFQDIQSLHPRLCVRLNAKAKQTRLSYISILLTFTTHPLQIYLHNGAAIRALLYFIALKHAAHLVLRKQEHVDVLSVVKMLHVLFSTPSATKQWVMLLHVLEFCDNVISSVHLPHEYPVSSSSSRFMASTGCSPSSITPAHISKEVSAMP